MGFQPTSLHLERGLLGQPSSTQIASGKDRRARPREQEMRGDPVPFETEKALPPRAKPLNLLAGEELLNLLARR